LIVAIGHVAVWTLLSVFTLPNAPLDTILWLAWGQELQWGYEHGPLPPWIMSAVFRLSGGLWGVYFLGQLSVPVCMWVVWRLGREYVEPQLAFAAAVLLECSLFFTTWNVEVRHGFIAQPLWAFSILFLYRGLTRGRTLDWLICGLSLGGVLLSKYYGAFLVASFLLFGAFHPVARRAWRTPGPYTAIATGLIVFFPHIVWLFGADFYTLSYALNRTAGEGRTIAHLSSPLLFGLAQLGCLLPTLLVILPLIGWPPRLREFGVRDSFKRDFLIAVVLIPPALYLLTGLITGRVVRTSYGDPLWTFAPLLLLSTLELRKDASKWRRAAVAWSVAATLILGSTAVRNFASPYLRDKGSRIHFPGALLAQKLNVMWEGRFDSKLPIVGGHRWPAANAVVYSPHHVCGYFDLSASANPWTDDADLRRRGGIVVWPTDDGDWREDFYRRFPEAGAPTSVELAWQTGANLDPLQFSVAMIAPASTGRNTTPE
jgi:hypothetical protein